MHIFEDMPQPRLRRAVDAAAAGKVYVYFDSRFESPGVWVTVKGMRHNDVGFGRTIAASIRDFKRSDAAQTL